MKDILLQMENANLALELSKSINLLDIVYFIHKAWEQVSAETVKNCFRKANFRKKIAKIMITVGLQKMSFHHQSFVSSPISLNEIRARFNVEDYINLHNDVIINDEDVESISTEMLITSNVTLAISSEEELERKIDDKFTSYKETYLEIKKNKRFCFTSLRS